MRCCELKPSCQNPYNIKQQVYAANGIVVRLYVSPERTGCQNPYSDNLHPERDSDYGNAEQQPQQDITYSQRKATEQKPDYITKYQYDVFVYRVSQR